MVPIYTVEKPGFINMIKVLDPRYVLPSRKFFSEVTLPQLYNSTRQRVAKELEEVSFYSATTDLWSSRTMQLYMSLTVHFINNYWIRRSVCLQTAYFPEDHTGEIIAQGLKDALNSWNLAEDRLICMTTDSGSNMIKALKDNAWPNLQCFGHRLHNAIENGVKDPWIDRAIGPEEEDAELTKTIKGKVMRYLDPVKDELLDMSSLVDPRFRTTYIDPDKVEPFKKRAVAEIMSLPAPANNSTPLQPGTAVQCVPDQLEQQDDLQYASVHFSNNRADPLYSNMRAARPLRHTEQQEVPE
ncbi:hypothetical protein JOQ06_013144 [Pogonophryne albipinna]|uniref:Zinc finger BED domain-containing 1-like protein n=1 Tax=Pogonophryne albipinna TaxID=1090488 RepID=A0AAD6FT77_9TELE|nr:hypothetical protein JOQ06_013144 [Pogonophryne albipinna]